MSTTNKREKEKKTKGKKSLLKSLKQLASHVYIPKKLALKIQYNLGKNVYETRTAKTIYMHDMTPHNLIKHALSDASHSVFEIVHKSLICLVKNVNSLNFTNYQEPQHICILKF